MNRWATTAVVALVVLALAAAAATFASESDGRAVVPVRFAILLAIAALGAFLPLSGALQELRHPTDQQALEIDTNYSKDDRYFALAGDAAAQTTAGPLHVREQEVDALKAIGDITLERGVRVARWIDSEGSIHAGDGSDLGARATALQSIDLGSGVRFRLLRAQRITTGRAAARRRARSRRRPSPVRELVRGTHRVRADGALIIDGPFVLEARAHAAGDIIARGNVTIAEGATLDGSVHCDGSISLERNAMVTRSIYCEGDVLLGEGSSVCEHVVSRRSIRIADKASAGTPGRITSVLADRDVLLGHGVTVYGRVVAGATGMTAQN